MTGEPPELATENGEACLLASLRLLVRICPNVCVALPTGFEELGRKCDVSISPLLFGPSPQLPRRAGPKAFRRHLVKRLKRQSPTTVDRHQLEWLACSGLIWLLKFPRRLQPEKSNQRVGSRLSWSWRSVKRLIKLTAGRGKLVDGLIFSLYDYTTNVGSPGPALPSQLKTDLLLVGAGAIGNGVVYLLSELRLVGHAWIVDGQSFQPEN